MADEAAIIESFEQLFAGSNPDPEPDPEPDVDDTPAPETDTEDTPEDNNNEPDSPSGTDPEPDPQSKQNHAFAELRTQNKKQAQILKSLGQAIGLDPNTSVDEVADKVKDILLQKQSKETNIPVETLREIEELKSLAQENKQIKLEQRTQMAFTDLAEKYKLSSEDLVAFANHLSANGKNPLDGVEVDMESEYLKLHFEDIVQARVDAALKAEQDRKQKVDEHAGSTPPGKAGGDSGSEDKINSVSDLDRYFNSL